MCLRWMFRLNLPQLKSIHFSLHGLSFGGTCGLGFRPAFRTSASSFFVAAEWSSLTNYLDKVAMIVEDAVIEVDCLQRVVGQS